MQVAAVRIGVPVTSMLALQDATCCAGKMICIANILVRFMCLQYDPNAEACSPQQQVLQHGNLVHALLRCRTSAAMTEVGPAVQCVQPYFFGCKWVRREWLSTVLQCSA